LCCPGADARQLSVINRFSTEKFLTRRYHPDHRPDSCAFAKGESAMFVPSKSRTTGFAFVLFAAALAPNGASAITLEVAKKCNALLAKAFPPREAGNPAAGSAKGSGVQQREYFSKCVANGGNMDDGADKKAK
jgi:hypothetical protein